MSDTQPKPTWTPRRIIMIVLLVPIVVLFYYQWLVSTPREPQPGTADPMVLHPSQSQPTQVNRPVNDFSLVNHLGEPVTTDSLKGQPWAAFFFYTTCPGPCLILNRSIEEAQSVLDDFPHLQFVGFTVDPEYDTSERLTEYAKNFAFKDGNWMYLTGDEEDVYDIVRNDFLLPVVETPEQMRASEGPITHSGKVALVNKNGYIVEYLDGMTEGFPDRLREALLRNGM